MIAKLIMRIGEDVLSSEYGAKGEMAMAYVTAHEVMCHQSVLRLCAN